MEIDLTDFQKISISAAVFNYIIEIGPHVRDDDRQTLEHFSDLLIDCINTGTTLRVN